MDSDIDKQTTSKKTLRPGVTITHKMGFSEQVRLNTIHSTQTNSLIGIGIYLLFSIFDYFYIPSIVHIVWPLRGVNIAILWFVFFLCKKNRGKYINALGVFMFGFTSSTICVYNVIVIKYEALPFWGSFTGINLSLFLFIFTAGMNMYWEARYTLMVSLIVVSVFLFTHIFLVSNYSGIPLSVFLLTSTSIIAVITSKNSYRYRFNDYQQKENLREANQKLQQNLIKIKKMFSIEKEAKREKKIRKELEVLNSKLKQVYSSRESFFSELSHEIRTPLTVILWKLDQLLDNRDAHTMTLTRKEIETLYRYSKRLIHKFNNILDLAQYENEKKLYVGRYDLKALISEFLNENLPMTRSKEIDFRFRSFLRSKTSFIYCDKEEIDKVFFNLFHNSLKYVKAQGCIQIYLLEDRESYTIEFQDDGVGISQEAIHNILDEFSREEQNEIYTNRHHPQTPSSGLGLALVRQAISAHQGSISVQSRHIKDSPGQHGTKFTIKLPKKKKHFEANPNVKFIKPDKMRPILQEAESFTVVDELKERSSVLIVDDNEEFLDLLEDTFAQKNYDVFTEESGGEGLITAKKEKPHLIITDIIMPGMTGIELIRELRKVKELAKIPVIILSGRLKEEKIPQDVRRSVQFVIQKPPTRKELLQKAQMLVQKRQK